MDDHDLILEFETEQEARACLSAINDIAAIYWQERGYTVLQINGQYQLIGKNALTGEDNPDAVRTITWDVIAQSPVGKYWFTSLSGDPRFYEGMEQLSGFAYLEKPFDPEMVPSDNNY